MVDQAWLAIGRVGGVWRMNSLLAHRYVVETSLSPCVASWLLRGPLEGFSDQDHPDSSQRNGPGFRVSGAPLGPAAQALTDYLFRHLSEEANLEHVEGARPILAP